MTSKNKYYSSKWATILFASALVGFLSGFIGLILKHLTENFEARFFLKTQENNYLIALFPILGLSVIFILRKYLFKNKENKGIREVLDATSSTKKLPLYKIPSHFINGFLTVIFGGSTGIEVSTVVSTAALGGMVARKKHFLKKYKNEWMGAAIAAGVTVLFHSPLAGLFFSYENILKRRSKIIIVTHLVSVTVAWGMLFIVDEPPLFQTQLQGWKYEAIPYFLILSIVASVYGVYLTQSVLLIKSRFPIKKSPYLNVVLCAAFLSLFIWLFPELYGDGYHAIKNQLSSPTLTTGWVFLNMVLLLFLKPIMAAITLRGGGDGGVFAPSIFAGAFLGILIATLANTFAGTTLLPLNFMILGIALVLSASLHAPFTAIFLVCGLFGDYTLFIPLLILAPLTKWITVKIYPYTVYNIHLKI
ncbi:chloride channel protein [Flavobacterium sp. NKUCC04_CG]|uniref:chloride channel protein n=1 Tax=Flavobacterium sp. NKUCC04_CG TaxID=2842121 RepID=UPI001C5AA694|nr:chloride channel protein [Flavobacterium sp. NKUCC04_CG]MBW3519144.1 chloride channel protein [Flavobacterium sp. NKUCC04_CG]